jgi:antitoxin MazE
MTGGTMITNVIKWGNSLALPIPRSFAKEMGLKTASSINMQIEKGRIILTPVEKEPLSLKDLVAKITKDNIHQEIETGIPCGNEIW